MAEMKQDNKLVRSLIQNAQNGKIVSLEELFRMNIEHVYAIILRMTASKSLAGLIGVNVLIKVWKSIKEFPNDLTFDDWMLRITFRITYEELKTGKLVKEKKLGKKIARESGVEEFLNVPLEKAISELDFEKRTLIVMNRIEQLSFNEIKDLTGITEDKAKDQLVKGIGSISRVFSEIEPEAVSMMQIEDLPKEIEPDRDIIQFTIDKIRKVKEEEFNEEDVQYEEIEKLPKHKIKFQKEKSQKREFNFNKNYAIVGIILLLIFIIIYYLNIRSNVWEIESRTGTVLLNNKPITSSEPVSEGDIVTTENASTAVINIKNLGEIEITPGSSIRRLEDKNTAKLISGKLSISTSSEEEYLFIEVPTAVVEEYFLSCDYTIDLKKTKSVIVQVSSGWLRIVSGKYVSIVPEGYELKILFGSGMSIPTAIESPSILPLWLEQYLFSGKKTDVLNSILDAAVNTEAITIWNLLKRVILDHRELVYEKLNMLVPHPEGVSKDGILNLNDDMLQLWLDEIDWLM
jgi:RNA polymerase sigma factor (sigma-70 family)